MLEYAEQLVENAEVIVLLAACLVGLVKREALKLAWDIDKDGDVDNNDVREIIKQADVGSLKKVYDNTKNLDPKYMDAIYNIGSMRADDAQKFLCAMFEMARVPAEDRDALIKAVLNGDMKDIDFIMESTDIPRLKALATIFKQLTMTSFLTGKDPTPDMKERIYQAMKVAVSGDTSELDNIKALFAE